MSTHSSVLAHLGWDDRLAAELVSLAGTGRHPGRVTLTHGRALTVATATGPRRVVVSPRLLATPPEGGLTTGDWVVLEGDSVVAALSRRSVLLRHAAGGPTSAQAVAANVDLVLIAVPLGAGVRPRRLERSLAMAWSSGARPVVLLTKADLSAGLDADVGVAGAVSAGAEVLAVSAAGMGMERLRSLLAPGSTSGVIGPSGAGKSTLINVLAGAETLATAEVRGDGRGRHTTSHRELVELPGGALLIDTPGMRELGVWDADAGIEAVFRDIAELSTRCRFRDCRHEREPGCAVQAAAADDPGLLERLGSRRKLEREQRRLDTMRDERALAESRRTVRRMSRALRRDQRR